MSNLTVPWLTAGQNQGLSLLSAFVGAMKALRSDPQSPSQEWSEAFSELTSALADGAKPNAISDADWATLQDEWSKLTAALGNQLTPSLRWLLYTLANASTTVFNQSNVQGLISYPLVTFSGAAPGAVAAAGLTFSTSLTGAANVTAALEIASAAPAWFPSTYTLPGAEDVFQLELQGTLNVGAGVNAAPAWGKVGVTANAQGSASLDIAYNYPSQTYVAQALLDSLGALPVPGDLDSLYRACTDMNFVLAGLDINGTANLQANLSAGAALVGVYAAAGSIPSWSNVPLSSPLGATANLSLAFSAGWVLDGNYRLTVENTSAGPYIRVARTTDRTSSSSIDISAQIGIEGLQAALDPVMSQILPSAQPLIDKLGKLGDLHSLILTSLENSLNLGSGNVQQVAQAILDVATGGGKTATSALSTDLQNIFDGYVNSYLSTDAAGKAGVVQSYVTSVQNRIQREIGQAVPAGFAGKINDMLGQVANRVLAECQSLATKLNGLGSQVVTQVVQTIAPAATSIADFITALQNQVSSATGPLVTWLQKYQDARTRVANAIADVQSRKLAFDVAASYQQKDSSSSLLEVLFVKNTPASQALYDALWRGDLSNYKTLRASCAADGSAIEKAGILSESVQTTAKHGFTLDIFGLMSASATNTALDNLSVTATSDGRVTAASDAATLSSVVTLNGSSTNVSLSLCLESLANPTAFTPLDAEFSAVGDKVTAKNVTDFFTLLEITGWTSKGTGSRINDVLYSGPNGTAATVANATISGSFLLDQSGWSTLLATTPNQLAQTVHQYCMNALSVAVAQGFERGGIEGSPAGWVQQFVANTTLSEDQFWQSATSSSNSVWAAHVIESISPDADPDWQNVSSTNIPLEFKTSLSLLWQVQRIATNAGTAWGAVQGVQDILANLKTVTDQSALIARLAAKSSQLKKGFDSAFDFEIPDKLAPIKVSWRFLGLISALAQLALPGTTNTFVIRLDTTKQGAPISKLFI